MTPETPEVVVEAVKQEPPVPTFTNPSPTSPSTVDIEALAEKVAERLTPKMEKLAQSSKDKRFSKIEQQLAAAGLAELEEMGVAIPDTVKTEYRLRQLEAQRVSVRDVPQGSGNDSDNEFVSQVIRKYELDANAPNVLDLLRTYKGSKEGFELAAANIKLKHVQAPAPSPSAAPSLQGGATSTDKSPSELEKEYQGKLQSIASTMHGEEKLRAITKLKGDYNKT